MLTPTSKIDCTGMNGSGKAYFVNRLCRQTDFPICIIVPTVKDAEQLIDELKFFMGQFERPLLYFPPYNVGPFKHLAYHSETAAQRIHTLYQMIETEPAPITVCPVGALLQRVIPRRELSEFAELVMTGEEIDREYLVKKLLAGGYTRTMIVEEPGDFCVRGGIIDLYSPNYSDPLRIELFGDQVESLRFFSASNQRKLQILSEAVILPAKEAVVPGEKLSSIIARVRERASVLEMPVSKTRDLVDRIREDGVLSELESLLSLIYPHPATLFDYASDNARFLLVDPADLERTADEFFDQTIQNCAQAREEKRLCVDPDELFMTWTEVEGLLSEKQTVRLKSVPIINDHGSADNRAIPLQFHVEDNVDIREALKRSHDRESLFSPLADWLQFQQQSGRCTFITCRSRVQADRLVSLLSPYGICPSIIDEFPDESLLSSAPRICLGQISTGFVWASESLAIVTEDEIFGSKRRRRRRSRSTVQTELLSFDDLKTGDLVVHNDHGIGQYEGLEKLKLDGTANDFLKIVYRGEDKLYLPVDRMNQIQKYMGVDSVVPVLDKMGGKSWERVKNKVKRSVEKIAGELLRLYASRSVRKGHAFSTADRHFQDFEGGFIYEETPDQLAAIDAVLQDMEQQTPMDRLVCGDVGYGKTEVALRASFKAVNDAKQVAVLVPTTVLSEQHFRTFSERFEPYPVNVACLSRFRSASEQRKIVEGLKNGTIDIVIGTHRLLQKDVGFKDLGLLVLDEEQRFGVKHKEKLKQFRSTVDVLALTATPLPRTLHMSLLGVRDISVISTPPEHRQSIITYVCEFDDGVVAEAVRKELKRNGQIFFIHNTVNNIERIASRLKALVPEVRLDIAHGRMKEDELERVMLRFMKKEIDMLVCTTIVESGLDIPSANTMLINRADRFGLSQIYQLRGRVGRSDEQAYAYLFIPRESALGKDAQKRLKVLMEHSDLGAGFQIAMNDLKIRGGGTILGAAQSGHIAAVGYDMFLKLMESTITEMKGDTVIEDLEPEINLAVSAYLPESYLPDIDQRLSTYRRLSRMTAVKEIADFKNELADRFGAPPIEVTNLLLKIMLRILSVQAGVKRLDLNGQSLALQFSSDHQKNPQGIVGMIAASPGRFQFTPDYVFKAKLQKNGINGLLVQTKNILKEIEQRVNN